MRRGILGGTFDPPHVAHLIVAEAARTSLDLDVVTFVPAGAPWQKAGRHISHRDHRWSMTCLAVAGVAGFESDDREVTRDGWSYTAETLETFPGDELFLILGADAASRVPSWHRPEDVKAGATIVAAPRPGTTRSEVAAAVGDHRWLDIPELPISGTGLRTMMGEGKSIRFYVREAVYGYVEENGLY